MNDWYVEQTHETTKKRNDVKNDWQKLKQS